MAKSVDGRAGIAEGNVVKIDSPFRTLQCFRVGRVLNRDGGVKNCENTLGGCDGPLHYDPQLA